MANNLVFNIQTYTDVDSTFPKPVNEDYDYWFPLLKYFLAKSDTIEIHCWNEESETIEEIKSMHGTEFDMGIKDQLIIFKAIKTTSLSDYLLYKSVIKDEEFKWFTVNLEKGIETVFHSGHWGTEFYIPNVTTNEIEFIKSVTPTETIFHHY